MANSLYKEALGSRRQLLGNSHPDTLRNISNYATLLWEQGKLAEARPLYKKALGGYQRLFGNGHQKTQKAAENYVNLSLTLEVNLAEALNICLHIFGSCHVLLRYLPLMNLPT